MAVPYKKQFNIKRKLTCTHENKKQSFQSENEAAHSSQHTENTLTTQMLEIEKNIKKEPTEEGDQDATFGDSPFHNGDNSIYSPYVRNTVTKNQNISIKREIRSRSASPENISDATSYEEQLNTSVGYHSKKQFTDNVVKNIKIEPIDDSSDGMEVDDNEEYTGYQMNPGLIKMEETNMKIDKLIANLKQQIQLPNKIDILNNKSSNSPSESCEQVEEPTSHVEQSSLTHAVINQVSQSLAKCNKHQIYSRKKRLNTDTIQMNDESESELQIDERDLEPTLITEHNDSTKTDYLVPGVNDLKENKCVEDVVKQRIKRRTNNNHAKIKREFKRQLQNQAKRLGMVCPYKVPYMQITKTIVVPANNVNDKIGTVVSMQIRNMKFPHRKSLKNINRLPPFVSFKGKNKRQKASTNKLISVAKNQSSEKPKKLQETSIKDHKRKETVVEANKEDYPFLYANATITSGIHDEESVKVENTFIKSNFAHNNLANSPFSPSFLNKPEVDKSKNISQQGSSQYLNSTQKGQILPIPLSETSHKKQKPEKKEKKKVAGNKEKSPFLNTNTTITTNIHDGESVKVENTFITPNIAHNNLANETGSSSGQMGSTDEITLQLNNTPPSLSTFADIKSKLQKILEILRNKQNSTLLNDTSEEPSAKKQTCVTNGIAEDKKTLKTKEDIQKPQTRTLVSKIEEKVEYEEEIPVWSKTGDNGLSTTIMEKNVVQSNNTPQSLNTSANTQSNKRKISETFNDQNSTSSLNDKDKQPSEKNKKCENNSIVIDNLCPKPPLNVTEEIIKPDFTPKRRQTAARKQRRRNRKRALLLQQQYNNPNNNESNHHTSKNDEQFCNQLPQKNTNEITVATENRPTENIFHQPIRNISQQGPSEYLNTTQKGLDNKSSVNKLQATSINDDKTDKIVMEGNKEKSPFLNTNTTITTSIHDGESVKDKVENTFLKPNKAHNNLANETGSSSGKMGSTDKITLQLNNTPQTLSKYADITSKIQKIFEMLSNEQNSTLLNDNSEEPSANKQTCVTNGIVEDKKTLKTKEDILKIDAQKPQTKTLVSKIEEKVEYEEEIPVWSKTGDNGSSTTIMEKNVVQSNNTPQSLSTPANTQSNKRKISETFNDQNSTSSLNDKNKQPSEKKQKCENNSIVIDNSCTKPPLKVTEEIIKADLTHKQRRQERRRLKNKINKMAAKLGLLPQHNTKKNETEQQKQIGNGVIKNVNKYLPPQQYNNNNESNHHTSKNDEQFCNQLPQKNTNEITLATENRPTENISHQPIRNISKQGPSEYLNTTQKGQDNKSSVNKLQATSINDDKTDKIVMEGNKEKFSFLNTNTTITTSINDGQSVKDKVENTFLKSNKAHNNLANETETKEDILKIDAQKPQTKTLVSKIEERVEYEEEIPVWSKTGDNGSSTTIMEKKLVQSNNTPQSLSTPANTQSNNRKISETFNDQNSTSSLNDKNKQPSEKKQKCENNSIVIDNLCTKPPLKVTEEIINADFTPKRGRHAARNLRKRMRKRALLLQQQYNNPNNNESNHHTSKNDEQFCNQLPQKNTNEITVATENRPTENISHQPIRNISQQGPSEYLNTTQKGLDNKSSVNKSQATSINDDKTDKIVMEGNKEKSAFLNTNTTITTSINDGQSVKDKVENNFLKPNKAHNNLANETGSSSGKMGSTDKITLQLNNTPQTLSKFADHTSKNDEQFCNQLTQKNTNEITLATENISHQPIRNISQQGPSEYLNTTQKGLDVAIPPSRTYDKQREQKIKKIVSLLDIPNQHKSPLLQLQQPYIPPIHRPQNSPSVPVTFPCSPVTGTLLNIPTASQRIIVPTSSSKNPNECSSHVPNNNIMDQFEKTEQKTKLNETAVCHENLVDAARIDMHSLEMLDFI